MRKILAALVCLLSLAGCNGCALRANRSNWDPMGDPEAAYMQELMRQTVQVDHELSTLVPELDTSDLSTKSRTVRTGMTGTGVVVASRGKESLVLTANHVCKTVEKMSVQMAEDAPFSEFPVLGERFYIWTIDLDRMPARVVYQDEPDDICALVVSGKAGKVATVGSDPPVGAIVQHVGSPRGELNYHRAFLTDGRYMGREVFEDGSHFEVLSVPADHGSSGGGVFYHGRLFGLVLSVPESFKHIAHASGDTPMRRAIVEGTKAWR